MTKEAASPTPQFPLTATFTDGDVWTLDDERDVGQNLEWHDSDDDDEDPIVRDSNGRLIRVKVIAHRVVLCELKV
jgi:hypothetical protein